MRRNTAVSLALGLLFVLVVSGCGNGSAPPEDAGDDTAGIPVTTPENAAPDDDAGAAEEPGPTVHDVQVRVPDVTVHPAYAAVTRYTQLFYDGELDTLFEYFSDEMKAEQLPLEGLREMRQHVADTYGTEVAILGQETQRDGEYRGFARWAKFSDYDGVIRVQWVLHDDDTIAGFQVEPSSR